MSSQLHMGVITSHNWKVYEMTYKRKRCIPRSRINTVATTQSWISCKANHKHGINKDFKGGGHGIHLKGLIRPRKSLARMAWRMNEVWMKCCMLLLQHPDVSYQSKAMCLQLINSTDNIEVNTLIMTIMFQHSL